MLISFSVSNFRSFGEEATLNMVASNKLNQHLDHRIPIGETGKYVLRSAVIYGGNAAGKSNLVKAMEIAQRLIVERSDRNPTVIPFRFRTISNKAPSSFEFRFLVNGRVFIYGFDIELHKVRSEWLAVRKGEEEVDIFQRNDSGGTTVSTAAKNLFTDDTSIIDTLKQLAVLPIRLDQLFLNRVRGLPSEAQGQILRAIINWFSETLVVLPAEARLRDILDKLHGDPSLNSFCSRFLERVGTGIGNLVISETEREGNDWERQIIEKFGTFPYAFMGGDPDTDIRPNPEDPSKVIVRKLFAEHAVESHKYSLPFCEESDGTQSLLHLMPILSTPASKCKVVVIDELDRSLHPLLCWEFIRFFSESNPGALRQLIVTTHEAHLLNQDLLRRDEYWFAEKDKLQQTRLVSLSEFNIRNDLNVQKGYLEGRFGAIPIVGGLQELEKLLECSTLEDKDAAQESSIK